MRTRGLSTISKNGLKIGDVVYLEQECRKHMLKTSKAFAVQSNRLLICTPGRTMLQLHA
jgi:predicted nicotinamide N-methyase